MNDKTETLEQAVAKLASQVREYRRYTQHSRVCDNDPRPRCRCGLDELNKAASATLLKYAPSEHA